jgi:hypothetical protein
MRGDKIRRKERNITEITEKRDKDVKKRETDAAGYVDAGW